MRFLVTGAAGFIGRAVVGSLVASGHEPVGLDLKERPEWWPHGYTYVQGDVCDPAAARQAAHSTSGIVHLAAEPGIVPSIKDPHGTALVNVMGTITMLDAARKQNVPAFAMASSCATLSHLRSGSYSPYAASKSSGEEYCRAFRETYGIQTSVLRLSNIYGPGSLHKGSAVAGLLKAGLREGRLLVTGDGLQTRDFLYVDDAASAFVLAVAGQRPGEFIVSSGRSLSILDVARMVAQRIGLPESAIEHKEALAGDTRSVYLDSSPTREGLGWAPETGFADGLERTVRWFREELS